MADRRTGASDRELPDFRRRLTRSGL